jgi:hypothetical protein
MNDVYKALAKHLDNPPGGYPETETELDRAHTIMRKINWVERSVRRKLSRL